ncbi:MAG: MarR family winged helix-turn-helix transcriptional regulator [Clostridiales bacterium]|jgi:DNA-binding MarR family transcriptional regulator|nr:MarR family winged helix-turn-helix transcriptional regulator [Clostridiales bacterium]
MSAGEKLIELSNASWRVCRVKNAVTLCDRLLFALRGGSCGSDELRNALMVSKSNLAHLCIKAEKDGLIAKRADAADRRRIEYSVTPAGKKRIDAFAGALSGRVEKLFGNAEQTAEFAAAIDKVLESLSFL